MGDRNQQRQGPTQTTVQTNQLPDWYQEPLKIGAKEAQKTFESGVGSTPYPGATYVPPGQDEMAGMERIRSLAGSNPFMQPATSSLRGILNTDGISQGHRGALKPAFDVARGRTRINTADNFARAANQFDSGGFSEGYLRDAAKGQFLGKNGNPHFNEALGNASRDTLHGVNAQMASMGRLGSDAHSGVAGREVGELQTRARADQHNLERQMQMQAAGQIDQARMSRLQGLLGALQGQTQVEGANVANQAQTALSLGDQYADGRNAVMRGMALAPALDQMRYSGARNLIDVGAAQRGELQDELQSNIDRFQGEQMQPWGQIGLLTSALQGFPNMSTVRSESSGTVPRGSRISGLLGGAAMGAGAGAKMGSVGGIPGAALGGLLGGGLGAFM